MAKSLLWIFFIVGFIMSWQNKSDNYTDIVTVSSLAVLAICESIEKVKKA